MTVADARTTTRAHGPLGHHDAATKIGHRAAATTIVHRGAATKISRRAVAMKTGRRAVAMKTGPPPLASRWANSGATPAKLAKVCAEARWTVIVAAVGVVAAMMTEEFPVGASGRHALTGVQTAARGAYERVITGEWSAHPPPPAAKR